MGRGTVGGGGGTTNGRPGGNGGGGPGSSSMGLSGHSSERCGGDKNEGGWGRGIGVEVSAGSVGFEAGRTGGTGREIGGGGGGAMEGEGTGTLAGPMFALSPGTLFSAAPLFSSGFMSSSEGNG